MKIKYLFYPLILIPLLISCGTITNLFSGGPEISIRKDFDGNGIAILNFSKIGPLPGDAGKLTADKLADAFFLNTRFNVIERARVNDAQASMEITNTEFMSSEQIQKLGQKLKANYLILGRIHFITEEDYFKADDDKKLNISFRIVSVANQEVVGVANYTCKYNDKLVEKIDDMIVLIASKISDTE